MYLARRFPRLYTGTAQYLVSSSSRSNSSNISAAEDRIKIPNRIQRSPTDILNALASTVGRDPTAPHYKYHDDPYLIPVSNVGKRTFALTQEAGRKAARFIREEHRDVFQHQEAQPPIAAFAPKPIYTEESEVDVHTLQELIRHSQITDAIAVYNLMKQKGMEIPNESKQQLLELLCFYNNEEPLPEEFIEERWFKANADARERNRKMWKDGDLAEKLFGELEPKTPQSYAALIRGMAKYYQAERAYALLQEATQKQFELDTQTFNAVISVSNFLKETADQRLELCQELLQQMAHQQLKPNLYTLNGTLGVVSTFGNFKFARSSALKILAEFKQVGIEPSLGTYYYLLIIFCRDRAPVSHIIVDILHQIKGREFTIQHPRDTFFFATAMDVCRNHLHDKSLAKKVDELLHTGNNYDLIGDTYKESVYYRHYFALLCQTEPIDEFMKTYDLLVPNVYIPEPGIMEEILKAVEIDGAVELMPRFWSDMVIFDHTNRESLLTRTLQILIDNPPIKELPAHQSLPDQVAKIAWDIYEKIADPEGRRPKDLQFTGKMIGDILALLVRGGNFEKASEVFVHIDKNQHRIPGTPSEKCLQEYIDGCIENKAPSQALVCLQYAVENNMETQVMAERIDAGFTLDEVHSSKLKALVGEHFKSK
ncbi:protein PTCD3 homolog, mitochondrial [Anastrepha obliqua]|uniref:protein PTCD3 homolog, mitochondrial n=1 Tax=Anastrepha obliqua TaxID=95512 RepID=UPI002409DB95|nr:protein PTCD3 homolog, mitochondrial [Anastrepha obliqua]